MGQDLLPQPIERFGAGQFGPEEIAAAAADAGVRTALARHRPAVTVVNAGAAQLPSGRSITMNTRDIAKICRFAPWTKIIAVHMEAINHCLLGREELRRFLAEKRLAAKVIVPENGETVVFE